MQVNSNDIPVVTVDGPSGSGKGTLTTLLARELNWHYLDSGVLYRALALYYIKEHLDYSEDNLSDVFNCFDIHFKYSSSTEAYSAFLNEHNIEDEIRATDVSQKASELAAKPAVRAALVDCQRSFKKSPGLVTDGRDMGTIIFPEAQLKLYLDATLEKRAERRLKQLKGMGLNVTLTALIQQMAERDARDSSRKSAPLKPADDAVIINTDGMSINEVYEAVINQVRKKFF